MSQIPGMQNYMGPAKRSSPFLAAAYGNIPPAPAETWSSIPPYTSSDHGHQPSLSQFGFASINNSYEQRNVAASPFLFESAHRPFHCNGVSAELHLNTQGDINDNTYGRAPLDVGFTNVVASQIAFDQQFDGIDDNIYRGHSTYLDIPSNTVSSPQFFPRFNPYTTNEIEPVGFGNLNDIASSSSSGFPTLQPGGINNNSHRNEHPYAAAADVAFLQPFVREVEPDVLGGPVYGDESNRELRQPDVLNGAVYGGEPNRELGHPDALDGVVYGSGPDGELRQLALGPQPTDVLGDDVNRDSEAPAPQRAQCGDNCRGDIIGPHQCVFDEVTSQWMISCQRTNTCERRFKFINDFYRHCQALHMPIKLADCPHRGCKRVGAKGFNSARPDNLLQHRRTKHKEDLPKVPVRFGRGSKNIRSRGFKRIKASEE